MKKLDKVILILFSVLIFLQAVLVMCLITGIVDIGTVNRFLTLALSRRRFY